MVHDGWTARLFYILIKNNYICEFLESIFPCGSSSRLVIIGRKDGLSINTRMFASLSENEEFVVQFEKGSGRR